MPQRLEGSQERKHPPAQFCRNLSQLSKNNGSSRRHWRSFPLKLRNVVRPFGRKLYAALAPFYW